MRNSKKLCLFSLVNQYLSELDYTAKIEKVKLLQVKLYKQKTVIPILYPQSDWTFNQDLGGYDPLLLSVKSLKWNLETKTIPKHGQPDNEITIITQQTDYVTYENRSTTFRVRLNFLVYFVGVFIFFLCRLKRHQTDVNNEVERGTL